MTGVFFTDRDLGLRFPEILKAAGLNVRRHVDHFKHDCPDEEWLAEIARRDWTAISHNERIRYTPNQLQAVRRNRVGLLIVVGKARFPELAESFVRTLGPIQAFVREHRRPFIAKVYRATPSELSGDPGAPGRIELWWPA